MYNFFQSSCFWNWKKPPGFSSLRQSVSVLHVSFKSRCLPPGWLSSLCFAIILENWWRTGPRIRTPVSLSICENVCCTCLFVYLDGSGLALMVVTLIRLWLNIRSGGVAFVGRPHLTGGARWYLSSHQKGRRAAPEVGITSSSLPCC